LLHTFRSSTDTVRVVRTLTQHRSPFTGRDFHA